jgi:hypothetical protein
MPRRDPALDDAIPGIAAILAEAHLRLLLGDDGVDSAETESLRMTVAGG